MLVWRACYVGFGRGVFAELVNLAGAVSVTVLSVNYSVTASQWVGSVTGVPPQVSAVVGFWGFFLIAWLTVRLVRRLMAESLKWDPVPWLVHGAGLVLGGLRGLWWAGFLVLALGTSGMETLQQSVRQRSVLGPRMLQVFESSLTQAADRFPGASGRGEELIPPLEP
jgi:uncharacterized membrane protein required for colicin V production